MAHLHSWAIALIAIVTVPCGAIAQTPPAERTQAASAAPNASNAEHPGKALYDKACASCHNNPEATKAPALDTLKSMRYQVMRYALTQGKMQAQAASLSADEKATLIEFLVGRGVANDDWTANMMCPDERSKIDLQPAATVATFGFDLKNQRHLTRAQSGLATADFANLELAWAIAFPLATTMRAQAAIVGTTLFLPVADAAKLYAIDISGKPCVQWVYQSDVPLRTSAAYGELSGSKRKVVAIGDAGSNVHLVDAQTGKGIWKQRVGLFSLSVTTGTPIIYKDRVYVPISQFEVVAGMNPKYECCKTHGAVVALDALTGKTIWTMHTMEDAKPIRDRGDGQMYWGPSGAPIWSSPAIDEQRGLLYVGTGEATSEPAHQNTDAILAVDLKDGSIRWRFQATADDIFLGNCGPGSKGLNCPKAPSVYRDVDFGASMILAPRANGKAWVLGGQKSGSLWAVDADSGKVVWQRAFGEGSPLGGIHWGIAFDGERVYVPINHPYVNPPAQATEKPGLHAVNISTGEVAWTFAAESDCTEDRQTRARTCADNFGFSSAPTVIDGAVIAGSLDGFLRAFDAKTGALLFKFDTAREFETLNGVKGRGGSFDAASIIAANGYLFVNSGYGMFREIPGNVLLAFKPKAAK